jgi:hypothetical protein
MSETLARAKELKLEMIKLRDEMKEELKKKEK